MQFAKKRRRRGATVLKRQPVDVPGHWKAIWGTLLRWLGVVLVLAGVGYGLWIGAEKLRDPNAFPLRHVRIEGELRNLAEGDLQPVAAEVLGQNFFMADLDALRTALADNPWVEKIIVRRGWPDVVEIELRERVAFGYWGDGEMVDVNGLRFKPLVLRQPGPWPRLSGPSGHETALIKTYGDVRALFEPVGLRLAKLRQDERRAWWLTFDNGLEVYVGREQFEQRLQRLVQLYPRILSAQIGRIAVVDLRYGNGFAVRWKTAEPPIPIAG
ncbi:MAG TPA: cell division protein FtsQ/DivIB [Candidatus Competibacteraceae bacterium]|nr:cell division protein FtsQ/DivIB [Candidatus Competibacteraceae bacterium]MCP5135023.1 cell division protein FtsQ/DivIB [Gammaproteobacteria bacterium]HPF57464.1 cell division protein FtsQ/DivIB [Candidatus Competibacteraceae bacterium]HRY17170.1 cell division protein FtsQ/DivIB [Candidatus Competibacteraceae bacterium]